MHLHLSICNIMANIMANSEIRFEIISQDFVVVTDELEHMLRCIAC